MALTIEQLIPKLVEAVNLVMNPDTPQIQRHEAYEACEDFKTNSPLCVQCGFVLAGKEYDQFVRHFGFQLLENSIKFRWNGMNSRDKVFIKENSMKLMAESTHGGEEAHIKDVLSRIVVEMIKREWPQHWPELLTELAHLANMGWAQMELVLLIFRRLAEDVVAFQSLPTQRRREILTTLTREMGQIYTFFLDQLVMCFSVYSDLKASGVSESDVRLLEAGAICCSVLDTLSAYVEWIGMAHIVERDSLLLQTLCTMLQHEHIQLPAAECLLLINTRKGKLEDRKPLLIMFSSDAMMAIFEAATEAAHVALEDSNYLFLKRLCQVMVAMGLQLAALWGAGEKVERPRTFQIYLEAMLAFSTHDSQVLSSYTLTLWSHFFRHDDIKKDPVMLSNVPKLFGIFARMMTKVGIPSTPDCHPSCVYSCFDFDSDDEFNVFFSRYRADVAECIRFGTMVVPLEAFKCAAVLLQHQLNKPLNIGAQQNESEHCSLRSPSFIEWDALCVFVECVLIKVTRPESMEMFVTDGIHLLNCLLQYDTKDPMILSCVLSNLSSLFPFITHQPNILPTVLDKIFLTAVFHLDGQTKATRSRAVRNVRRHACSILIKLSKAYPHLLLPGFEQLYEHIKKLNSDPEELSQLEKITLMEALVLISNKFLDFEKQSAFIGEIMAETRQFWMSEQLKAAISSADKFMSYVGLDEAPVEPSSEDTCGINRSQVELTLANKQHIVQCVNIILAVMKRSEWPADVEAAQRGGFVTRNTTTGADQFINPASKHLLPLLDHVFMLARTMNEIWLPEHLSKRHPEFAMGYELNEMDKRVLLGITPPSVDNTSIPPQMKQPVDRMQAFLTAVPETCAHILGNTGACLGHEFYQAPRLATFVINSYLVNLDAIPDFRMRYIVRSALKPYVQSCPKEYYPTAVVPVLEVLGPYMLQRLSNKWQTMDQKVVEEKEEEDPLSDEVINLQLIRLLSREYLEFLATLFRDKRGGGGGGGGGCSDSVQDEMTMDEENTCISTNVGKDETISELGVMVFKSDTAFPSLVMTLFSALSWEDSTSCHKCSLLCWPVLKHLLACAKLTSADACHLFQNILQGMHAHGQHEATQAMLITLGLQVYENMRPVFPEVTSVLLQIPKVTEEAVKQFDDKILSDAAAKNAASNASQPKQLPEKRKKELFRKLIQTMIGKHLGQQFKADVHIKNLPPLIKASKPQPLEDSENLGLCSLFLP